MAKWRSPELEAIVGGPLDDSTLTDQTFKRLVVDGAREGEQLDFKQAYSATKGPRGDWSTEQEFAKDVAAFANHRGGLIVIGIREVDEVASATVPISGGSGSADEQRLRAALGNYLVPLAETYFVHATDSAGARYISVVIPPSRRAPHAVMGNPGNSRRPMHFPVRHGSDVMWLTPHEVAGRFRRQAMADAEESARNARVLSAGRAAIRRAEGMWMWAACVPEMGAEGRLTRTNVQDTSNWFHQNLLVSPWGRYLAATGQPIPAPGRVTFTGARYLDSEDPADVRDAYAELFIDGSAFAATPVEANTSEDVEGVGVNTLVDDLIILVDLVVSWTSRQVGAWGTATLTCGIDDTDDVTSTELRRPLELVVDRFGTLRRAHGTRLLRERPLAESVVDLANVGSVQDRLAVTAAAAAGLLQWFGIAEPSGIFEDGAVDPLQWGRAERQVEQWAADRNVEVRRSH